MRSFKSILLMWLPVVALLATFTACDVAEDESECVVDMHLTFRFTKDGADRFGVEVPSLSVFVFDQGGKFVGRWDENDNTKFGADYTMSLPLSPGTYSFVVWGGLKDAGYYVCLTGETQGQATDPVVGETAMSELRVLLTGDTRNSYTSQKNFVDYVPGALFFGSTGQLTLEPNTDNNVTVDLNKDSKRINLTIIGMPPATRANPYPYMDITLDSPNGCYDFWNDVEAGGRTFTYVQHDISAGGADTQLSTFYTLSMKYGNGHRFTIYNTQTAREFYTADLLEDFIRKVPAYNTQDAVDAEDEFDITVDVRLDLGVTVTVNGWDVGVSGNTIQ